MTTTEGSDATPNTRPEAEEGHHHDRYQAVMHRLAPLLVVLTLAVPFGLVWWAQRSSASFADRELFGVNSLGAATVEVAVGNGVVDLWAANVAPGDEVGGQVEIRNVGDLPIRYAVLASTGDGQLSEWVSWDAWIDSTCRPERAGDVGRRDFTIGSELEPVIGDAATGTQSGDRALAVGQAETLCLLARLPIQAPNEVQGRTMELSITIAAEHDLEDDR